jgi:RNA polymerase sigma factor (sigma-70 family)
MTDDRQLLRQFATERSESAFSQLVARHLPLVYSTALRQTNGDTHLAQDAAQLVFTDLARKAPSLSENVVLAGWLHRATLYAARQILRGERRRQAREQQAVTMNSITSEPETDDWRQIRPLLDEALERLNKAERDTLLLRFFEQQSLAQIGASLGSTEDAVRKRITRALEKLRGILQHQGVNTTAAALSTSISANAVQVAPIGLATTLASASFTTMEKGTAFTFMKMITASKLKLGICALVIAGVVSTFIILHQTRAQTSTHSQNDTGREVDLSDVSMNLQNVPFPEIFRVYTNLCNAEKIKVDADESVKRISKRLTFTCKDITASEAIQFLEEQAFKWQCGIEVLHPSTNEVVLRLKQ